MSRRFRDKISRRAFLRGSTGAILSLPLAEFTLGADKVIAAPGDAPKRLFTMFFPNGFGPNHCRFETGLAPLAGLRNKVLGIYNLANPAAAETQLPEGHGSGAATAFTGIKTPDADPKGLSGGPTIEHFAASQLKPNTLLPYLVTGLVTGTAHHTNMFGVHCFVRSWQNANVYVAPVKSPLDLFNTLFGREWQALVAASDKEKLFEKSVLDTVMEQYKEMASERYGLGAAHRTKLNDHLDAVRQLEKAALATDIELREECKVPPAAPAGVMGSIPYSRWDEIYRQQTDLLVLALRCDMTRFGHISFGESAEYYQRPEVGARSGHEFAHDSDQAGYTAYIAHHMRLFAELWTKLDAIKEANDKSILDNSLFYVASELGDQARPNHHSVDPTAVVIAGGAGGLAMGRLLDASGHTINDALTAALRAVGVNVNTFGTPGHNRSVIT